jgi:uncharacterized protein
MVHNAVNHGYAAVVVNHLVPKDEPSDNLRCLDFSDTKVMSDVNAFLKQQFPESEVFGVGFSLGGCYLLKAVGAENSQG